MIGVKWTEGEVYDAFVSWLVELGIPPASGERVLLDGLKHRYAIQGDRGVQRNGEYRVYLDERPAGYAKSFSAKHGVDYAVWSYLKPGESPWTEEQRREYMRQRDAAHEAARQEKELSQARAVQLAVTKWKQATEASPKHGYFRRKGLDQFGRTWGARLLGADLIIPVRNAEGKIQTIQTISADGQKKFQAGAPLRGGVCFIGGDEQGGSEVFLAEGFATGATVHEATGRPVCVCFDCGNLVAAAATLRERFPGRLVTAADNDRDTNKGNAGMAAAFKLLEEYGIPFTAPEFRAGEKGTDWNDYNAIHGIEETSRAIWDQLEQARKAPEVEKHTAAPRWVHEKKNGGPVGTLENLQVLLRHAGVKVQYDEVKKDIAYDLPGVMGAGKYGPDNRMNAIYAEIVSLCERYGFPTVNLDGYLTAIASENRVNPVLRWIRGKEWDGVDRLEALGETLSLDGWFPPELKKLLVRRWLVSAVAAASSENFKARGVLVLQGPQGIGKTSWFQALVPAGSEWFLDGVALDPEDKDSLKKVISHWIIELGELEATFKKADINKLKSYITSGVDVVRLPWARKMSTFPRRTVFCASVNQAEFLVDTTGNSRWWVLPCRKIQYRHDVDVQQVWAQALDLLQRGEPWWLSMAEEAELERITHTFEAGDEVSDLIVSKFNWEQFMPEGGVGMEWMNATNALIACGVRIPTKAQVRRAGEVLRELSGPPKRKGRGKDKCYLLPPTRSNTYYDVL